MSDFKLYNDLQKLVQPTPLQQKPSEGEFGNFLKEAVDQVNSLEKGSNQELQKFMNNEADLHSVMIALQKADLSFQMMMQVRNKIVQAYQELMRAQV